MLAVTAGVLAGCVVSLIRFLSHLLHSQLYGVAFSTGLSGSDLRRNWLLIAVPVAGGC